MLRIYTMLLDAFLASVIMAPLFLYLNKTRFRSIKKTICYWLLATYFCAVYAVAGLPDICYIRFHLHFNIRPFAYMFTDLDNTLLNILFFVPLGFSLPVFWKKYNSLLQTIRFGFLASLVIEGLQIFTYRASDINDLMTNTMGTFFGWCLARILMYIVPSLEPGDYPRELYGIAMLSFAVMFFLHPVFSNVFFL